MSFNDIKEGTKKSIITLFEKGFTPSLAYKEMIRVLRTEVEDDAHFHVKMSDRSEMPRRSDFNFLYKLFNNSKYGTREVSSIQKHLKGDIFYFLFTNYHIIKIKKKTDYGFPD